MEWDESVQDVTWLVSETCLLQDSSVCERLPYAAHAGLKFRFSCLRLARGGMKDMCAVTL